MTQKEKAIAYDRALEMARKIKLGVATEIPNGTPVIDAIFPELKETEDEKMWKLIKKYAHANISDMALNADHITREYLESWLEKQGEKCSFDATDEELIQAKKDAFNDALDKIEYSSGEPTFDDGWWAAIKFIRQKQWKPTKEQMGAFSELAESEDERIRKVLVDFFENYKTQEELGIKTFFGIPTDNILAWLEKQGKETSTVVWHSVSEAPNEMKEVLCEWESDDATWHDVAFYHADAKTFWNGERQVIGVTRWCYVDELFKKQGEQKPVTFGSREDEKIRKWLIAQLEIKSGSNDVVLVNRIEEAIAWLEKQGEKVFGVDFNAKDWYVSNVDGKIYNAKFMEKPPTNLTRKLEIEKAAMSATGIIEQEEWFIKGAEWADRNPSCVQQGEQKPVQEIEPTPIFRIGDTLKRKGKDYTFRVDRIQGGYYHCDCNHGAFFPIEEQGNWELVEQKTADKVEPKFKVGDIC